MADLTVTASDVLAYAGARTTDGTAGAAITAGQVLYKDATDGTMKLADASTAAKAAAKGIALNNAAVGQPVKYLTAGGIDPGAVVTVGTIYGVTDTAGGIGPVSERAAADFITILGVAVTASRINVDIAPSGVAVPEE
jgi:hypothetical protein